MIDRAAEVHVDEIRAARFDERGGPAHLLRVGARELHGEARLVRRPPDQRELRPALLLEPPGYRHLAHRDARAELDAEPPVRQVRALRHGAHDHGPGQGFAQGSCVDYVGSEC